MNGGELNFCLKWNADKGMSLPPQAFEMNGKGKVILYKKAFDNEEDAVKGEEKAVEKAGEEGTRLLTAAEIYTEMRHVHGVALRDVSCTAFARILPELGERVHTKYCNGYWVVKV